MKKMIIICVLVLSYFLIGWVTDMISNVVVLSASGLAYDTKHHLLYNEFNFYSLETGAAGPSKINLRLERLFLLGTAAIFIGLELYKKFKNK